MRYELDKEKIKKAKKTLILLEKKKKSWLIELEKAKIDKDKVAKKYYHGVMQRIKWHQKELDNINIKIEKFKKAIKDKYIEI